MTESDKSLLICELACLFPLVCLPHFSLFVAACDLAARFAARLWLPCFPVLPVAGSRSLVARYGLLAGRALQVAEPAACPPSSPGCSRLPRVLLRPLPARLRTALEQQRRRQFCFAGRQRSVWTLFAAASSCDEHRHAWQGLLFVQPAVQGVCLAMAVQSATLLPLSSLLLSFLLSCLCLRTDESFLYD